MGSKRNGTNELAVSGSGESKRTPPQEPLFLEASPMAKASLLRKEEGKKKTKTNQAPKRRGGPSQERHWSGNDEILRFLKQGF